MDGVAAGAVAAVMVGVEAVGTAMVLAGAVMADGCKRSLTPLLRGLLAMR